MPDDDLGLPSRPVAPRRADALALAVVVAVPVLVYGIPALAGHPILPGDDLTQNVPLRVLVGRQLRAGTAPLLDPYEWSGSALLGGWNAGAMSPFTWLFAVLPATAAWALSEMAVYAVAGAGAYLFARDLRLRPAASFIGAVSFALAGAEELHLGNFGLVQGTAWLPWVLLALSRLDRRRGLGPRLRWVAALGLFGALVVVAGEPRAISTVGIVGVVYLAWLVLRRPGRAPVLVLSALAAGALGAALSAVQWLPGLDALATSQRSGGYALFVAGSTAPAQLSLLLVPVLLGGSGSFGTASWFVSYNLPEVVGYVGLVPAASLTGLLVTVRRHRLPPWAVWAVLSVLGGVLAVGGSLPALAHVLVHVPLFGGQRLQSRNIAITDVGLAMLAAYWADHAIADRLTGAERLGALLPVVGALALAATAWADPAGVAQAVGATAGQAEAAARMRPLLGLWVGLAVVVAAAVLALGRLRPPARAALLVAVVVVDVAAFELADNWAVAPGPALVAAPSPAVWASGPVRPIPGLGRQGRFVVYDPDLYAESGMLALGQPDRNILSSTFSALGYTAIVDGTYAAATGGHAANGGGTNSLDPSALTNGVFDSLDTTTLLTVPQYLVSQVPAGRPAPGPGPAGRLGPGDRTVAPGSAATWFLGQPVRAGSVSVAVSGSAAVQLGVEDAAGRVTWAPTAPSGTPDLPASFAGVRAVAVVARSSGPVTLGPPVVTSVTGNAYEADGVLQGGLAPAHWSFAGDDGAIAVFTNRRAAAPLTLMATGRQGTAGATVRPDGGPALAPSAAAVSSPAGVTVVRAVAAIPGWHATWQAAGHRPVTLPVERRGVVQAVTVPPGHGALRWRYQAPGWPTGRTVSEVGLAALAALWVAGAGRRRPHPARPEPT